MQVKSLEKLFPKSKAVKPWDDKWVYAHICGGAGPNVKKFDNNSPIEFLFI